MPGTTRSRRRLPPVERRGELVDAAVRVLGRLGPAGCRVEDITGAAGTAKGNFYRYFDTVDDLLVAVRDHLFDQYVATMTERHAARLGREPERPIDWWAVLDEEITLFVDHQVDLGRLHEVLFHGPAAVADPLGDERSAGRFVARIIEAGVAAGAFVADDPAGLGELLFHALHGATDAIAAGADRDRMLATTIHLFHRALSADVAPKER